MVRSQPQSADAAAEPQARLYVGSSERMQKIESDSVALTVTSPPYWNSIDYDIHAKDKSAWHRTRQYAEGFETYEDYLDRMVSIFTEVRRVTRPGGFCAIVIGTCLLKGRHYPVPADLVARLSRADWEFHQDIIWHKVTAGIKRAGVFIQKPYPGYFYPNIMTEYILILRKPGKAIYEGVTQTAKSAAGQPINRLFTMDIANNVWHIAPVPPGLLDHPCPFPEEIPYRLINLYSYPGDTVLDPFAGSGQTTKVAAHLGRSTIGYDIVPEYIKYARSRLNEPLAVRPMQLIARYDKIDIAAPAAGPSRDGTNGRRGPDRKPAERKQTPPSLPLDF